MSREEAIKYLNEFIIFKKISNITEEEAVECFKLAVEALQEQPKTEQEAFEDCIRKAVIVHPKKGHWIGNKGVTVYPNSEGNLTEFIACKCSECGEWLTGSDEYVCGGRFCPSCGIKMEEKK